MGVSRRHLIANVRVVELRFAGDASEATCHIGFPRRRVAPDTFERFNADA